MIDPNSETTPAPPVTDAPGVEPAPSADWSDLIAHPTRFFASDLPYNAVDALPFIAWIVGMSAVIDRIDRNLVKADLGETNALSSLAESWFMFWGAVLLMGALSGLLRWHLGAWWYRVRLRWSGAIDPDHHRARVVYLFAALVWDGPAVLLAVIETMLYPNYLAGWNALGMGAMLIFFPLVWSFVVSYRGARAAFEIRRGAARFWFLIAPLTMLLLAFLAIGGFLSANDG